MARIIKKLPALPAERALALISGRWKVNALYHLLERPQRLSELRRLIPGASQKVLVQQLRELEAHGVVARKVFAQVPPRVEYSLTRLGKWGRGHEAELDAVDALPDSDALAPPLGRAG